MAASCRDRSGLLLSLLALKVTGSCTVTVPEWPYDWDCPGHYHRRRHGVIVAEFFDEGHSREVAWGRRRRLPRVECCQADSNGTGLARDSRVGS